MSVPKLFALQKRTLMIVLMALLVVAGLYAYSRLGRLEDPTFTIKTALVVTSYPGASASEVEEEVTDPIEEAIQAMGQIKEIYSTSKAGMSYIYVDIKDEFHAGELPQVWDELRRKVNDVQVYLPPGAGPSRVNDGFGDVFGVFFAITGPDASYAELKDYADSLKTELLKCRDVAKISLWGEQQEAIYVEFQRARLVQLGLTPTQIVRTLQAQNQVQRSGQVKVGGDYLRISPTGDFTSDEQIANLLLGSASGVVRLGDIARIYRDYTEPPRHILRYNGQAAIGLGISTIAGGNVVLMGDAVRDRLEQLADNRPDGIELHTIYYQSREVTKAVDTFIVNLLEAVLIVIVLLMLFMGWRSGLLIGTVLLLTILGTFIGMFALRIDLQTVSLGALILALGMLVDNAIVVVDGTLIRMERGRDPESAAGEAVLTTRWPLFGATLVAILAFTAIGFSPGNVGEYCRSLFYVMALSLFISWLLAISVTPLFCVRFLKAAAKKQQQDPYAGRFYRIYRRFLHYSLRFRWLVLGMTLVTLGIALFGFQYVPKAFFPDSTKPYFFVYLWNPEGAHIDETAADISQIEEYLQGLDGVTATTSFVGEGGLRFILTYDYQLPDSSYGQLLVEVDDYRGIDRIIKDVETYLHDQFPHAEPYAKKIQKGPNVSFKIEARFRGEDIEVLKQLAAQAEEIFAQSGNARDLRSDWRNQVTVIRPEFSQVRARYAGVSRKDLSDALQWNFNGITGGLYREDNKLIPIIFRSPEKDRSTAEQIGNIQVWSPLQNAHIPLRQVVSTIETRREDPLVQRRDRQKTVTVQCNPESGLADDFLQQVQARVEAIELPVGYHFEWGGEYESSQESQEPLLRIFPLCLVGMFVVVVWLFNSFRRPLIIFLTVPLSLIGVTAGLLLTGLPFGFMAILGFLGLSGMLIKNAIVLIDQIEMELAAGTPAYRAVLDSSVSRMRPVIMASGTTILGMIPLVSDPFYAGMAATIMSGLFAATFLTLVIVPVAYTVIYRVPVEKSHV